MKKFYTLFILAFVAIAVNAQVLKDAQAIDGRRPLVKHEMPSVFTPAPSLGINKLTPSKRAARRISSRDDILGSYLQIYYSYFDQSYTAVPLTIMRNTSDKKGVLIKGWWGDFTKPLKATVDVENGTISIAANQKLYEYTGDTPANFYVFPEEEGDPDPESLIGYIGDGGIFFDGTWGAKLTTSGFYVIGLETMLVIPNGKMKQSSVDSSTGKETASSEDVFITQQDENVTVVNFMGNGFFVDITLTDEQYFYIDPEQVVYSYTDEDDSGEEVTYEFKPYSLLNDDTELGMIYGTGTDKALTFVTDWTLYDDSGRWFGKKTKTTIEYTDDSTFDYSFETGIAPVKIEKANEAIYGIDGRRLNEVPAKGLYIQNGKKYIAK